MTSSRASRGIINLVNQSSISVEAATVLAAPIRLISPPEAETRTFRVPMPEQQAATVSPSRRKLYLLAGWVLDPVRSNVPFGSVVRLESLEMSSGTGIPSWSMWNSWRISSLFNVRLTRMRDVRTRSRGTMVGPAQHVASALSNTGCPSPSPGTKPRRSKRVLLSLEMSWRCKQTVNPNTYSIASRGVTFLQSVPITTPRWPNATPKDPLGITRLSSGPMRVRGASTFSCRSGKYGATCTSRG
mmetsp:Transcript_3656/g.5640  ORF Transcript_3656/g.5640 Transcript_3656/m.5640 type:complete len:243 (-) Transcript_3656:379-1107(-)